MDNLHSDQQAGGMTRRAMVYELIASDIKSLGVECVFGLMSDDTCGIAVSLDSLGLRFIGSRHENNAVMMADGYASATGKLAVVVIGRGPALGNAVNAMISTSRTASKILVISGDPHYAPGTVNGFGPDLKGFPFYEMLTGAGLPVFRPTSTQAVRQCLADAVAVAQTGRVVNLMVPGNIQDAEIEVRANDPIPARLAPPPKPQPGRASQVAVAAEMLSKARRPLIIGGMGAFWSGARPVLDKLAEQIGALCVTTLRAKDLFRGSPYDIGIIGSSSHSLGRRQIAQADCIITFGAGLNFLTTTQGKALPPDVPLIQVDARRDAIGRWWYNDASIVGDAKLVAEQLLAALPARPLEERPFHAPELLKTIAAFDQNTDFKVAHTPRTLDPRALAAALDRMLPQDRNVVWDAGNFFMAAQHVSVPNPGLLKLTSEFGSISLGMGAAMGFAKGQPSRPTVLLTGDGGLMMALSELETVVREDIPLVIAVFNDCAYGAEVHILAMRNLPVSKAQFPDVDLAPVAEAFGFEAHTIRTMAELEKLAPLLADPQGPIFLDCKVNGAVVNPVLAEFNDIETKK